MKIVGVRFNEDEQLTYYYVKDLELKKNVTVIVEDNDTLKFGKVVTPIHNIEEKKLTKELGNVVRIINI